MAEPCEPSSAPRIAPIPLVDPPENVRESFALFMARRGNVPNLFRTLALRPELMNAWFTLLDTLLNTGTVPTALKEMVIVRVSVINGSGY